MLTLLRNLAAAIGFVFLALPAFAQTLYSACQVPSSPACKAGLNAEMLHCEAGNGAACEDAGELFNLYKYKVEARAAYAKGCALNHGKSCSMLGYYTAIDLKDHATAAPLFEKACTLGYAEGCNLAAKNRKGIARAAARKRASAARTLDGAPVLAQSDSQGGKKSPVHKPELHTEFNRCLASRMMAEKDLGLATSFNNGPFATFHSNHGKRWAKHTGNPDDPESWLAEARKTDTINLTWHGVLWYCRRIPTPYANPPESLLKRAFNYTEYKNRVARDEADAMAELESQRRQREARDQARAEETRRRFEESRRQNEAADALLREASPYRSDGTRKKCYGEPGTKNYACY